MSSEAYAPMAAQPLLDELEQIRQHYAKLRLDGVADAQAFDRCDDAFGYVQAVRALKAASPQARRLHESYWRKRRAEGK